MRRRAIAWQDYGGFQRMTQLTCDTTAAATFAGIVPLTNANWINWHEGAITSPAVAPASNATYSSVGEVMAVSLIDALGTSHRVFIPAPKETIFTADDNTADVVNVDFFALINSASFTLAVPQTSLPVALGLAGWLFRRSQFIREGYSVDGSNPLLQRCDVWKDTFGVSTIQVLQGVVTMGPFITQALNCSNAVITQSWEGPLTVNPTPMPLDFIYVGVKDYAKFVFCDVNGGKTNVVVPAPNIAIFESDKKTVKMTQANVAFFVTQALTELFVPSSGLPVVRCLGGMLVRTRATGIH